MANNFLDRVENTNEKLTLEVSDRLPDVGDCHMYPESHVWGSRSKHNCCDVVSSSIVSDHQLRDCVSGSNNKNEERNDCGFLSQALIGYDSLDCGSAHSIVDSKPSFKYTG